MRLHRIIAALAFVALTGFGCAGTPTDTPNDQAALCIQGITAGRKAATALLRAGKLTVAKHHTMQESFDSAVPGCKLLAEQGVAK